MEQETSKSYEIEKTTIGSVLFEISNVKDESLKRLVQLTPEKPKIRLPRDWALGIFNDPATLAMLKKGYISFSDNASAFKDALDADIYFGDMDDIPVKEDLSKVLLALKGQNKAMVDKYLSTAKGKQDVVATIRDNLDDIPNGMITYVEQKLGISLKIEEE